MGASDGKMRVLLLTDADAFAGTERHMLDLAIALREVGVLPTLSCPAGAPLAQRGAKVGLTNLAIEKGGLVDWRAVGLLRHALKDNQFDILHAHNGRTHLSAALAILLARRGSLVFTQHFIEPGHTRQRGLKSALFGRVHHFVAGRTHRFIAISRAVKSAMLERGEADASHIEVVPNGIGDPQHSDLTPADRVRSQYDIPADAPLLVCAARLEPEKDHATLIDAFAVLHRDFPLAHLLLAGRGVLESELKAQIEERKLTAAIRVVGFVDDAHSLIAAADIFVLPSPREPFGLVFIEAMALEKPVVACQAGAAPEIVVAGKTGILVPPHSADAMSDALCRLLGDSAMRRAMGQAGRHHYLEAFTREKMAQGTLTVYKDAMRAAKGNQL
jgi:glycosyltransferase involved in cell wall biosynthesis